MHKSLQNNPRLELKTGLSLVQLRQAVSSAGGDPLKVKYVEN